MNIEQERSNHVVLFYMYILQLEKEITQLKTMSTRRSIHVMDFLAEDLLYIIPLSINSSPSDPVPHDPFSARLTRRHTPKYKLIY